MYTEVDNLYNGIGAYRRFKAKIRCMTMIYVYSQVIYMGGAESI